MRFPVRRVRLTPSTTAAPTWGSRSTGAASKMGCLPATGTTPASTSSRAAHWTRSPTTSALTACEVESGDVVVVLRPEADPARRHLRRLEEGLEQGLTLVIAKAVLGSGRGARA